MNVNVFIKNNYENQVYHFNIFTHRHTLDFLSDLFNSILYVTICMNRIKTEEEINGSTQCITMTMRNYVQMDNFCIYLNYFSFSLISLLLLLLLVFLSVLLLFLFCLSITLGVCSDFGVSVASIHSNFIHLLFNLSQRE